MIKQGYFQINGKNSKTPIIQGGMGIGISFNRLVKACIKAGAVGTLSSAQAGFKKSTHKSDNFYTNLNAIKEQIDLVREECPDGILGVNVMHATNGYEETCRFLAKCDIDFIISGAGLPTDLPEYIKDTKVKGAVIVSSAKSAKVLLRRWERKYGVMPEFVVVEGPLAGGHLGFTKEELAKGEVKNLEELCEEVINLVKEYETRHGKVIPVIAAGGITTSEEIKQLIDLGCSGVQIATKFIATEECDVHKDYKLALVNAREEDIVEIASPVGYPGRAINNNLSKALKQGNQKVKHCVRCLKGAICNARDIPYCITERLGNACLGDVENGLVFTGANGYLINEISTVEKVMKNLLSKID